MTKQIIRPEGMQPTTGFSHAVVKKGTPVFFAGQVAADAEGKVVGEGDIVAQAEQVYKNIGTLLAAVGGTWDDVVKMTVFAKAESYRTALGAERRKHFPEGEYPASTFIVITELANPAYLVEIEAVAMLDL